MAELLQSFLFSKQYNTELVGLVLLSSLITSVLAYECNQNCAQHCNKPDCASEHRSASLPMSIALLVLNVVLILYYLFQVIRAKTSLENDKIIILIKFALPIHAVTVGALAIDCTRQCADSKNCKTKAWKDYVKAVASINIILGIFSAFRLWYNLYNLFKRSRSNNASMSGKFELKGDDYAISQEAVDKLKKFWDNVAKQADQRPEWKSM